MQVHCRKQGPTASLRVPDAYQTRSRCVPDAYQMRTRCVSDAYQMRIRCVPEAYQNLRLRTWLGCDRFRASAIACVGTRCGAMPVGFEPQVLRQDGTVCQTAGTVVCDSRRAVAAPPSRHVELETYSTMPRSSAGSSVDLLKVRGLGLFYHWHWTCCGRHPHADGKVLAPCGAAVVSVM